MAKYRVYEVAEQLDAESSQLIEMLRSMGVAVRSHMSTIDEEQVARLHARMERERRSGADAKEDGGSGGRRRRRRRRRRRTRPEEIEAEESSADAEEAEDEEVADEDDLAAEAAQEEVTAESAAEEVVADAREDAVAEAAEEEVSEEEPHVPEIVEVVGQVETAPERDAAEEEAEEEVLAEAAADVEDVEVAVEEAAEEASEEDEAAEEDAGKRKKRARRKPKPVRRGMPRPGPAASAAPGGKVEIDEGYSSGRGGGGRGRKKRPRVDQDAVKENVKKTLASLEGGGGGGGRKKRRDTRPAPEDVEEQLPEEELDTEVTRIRVNEFLTVAELADLIDASPQEIITSAFKNLGLMVTINQRLDFDQIELICEEFGYEAVMEEGFEAELPELAEDEDTDEELVSRAPVVTVMGHVDHGKTSLLDHIRKENVVAGEAGGITQHIGAYRVHLDEDRAVTFLDTPGHEAFTAMRARGAELTDVVVLVVAADDSVMPQTIEAISHARNAGVPLVVAINKIDLPTADADRVKQELLNHEVVVEEFGGEVLAAEVSAETGEGIDELLEQIYLQSELLELAANPDTDARGTVVEAELDRGMGPLATVLIQNGTLRVGDDFICGVYAGRVRALLDERGNNVDEAGPSTPVRVLGLEGVPQAGDTLAVLPSARVKEVASRRQQLEREKDIRRRSTGTRLEDVFEEIQAGEQPILNLVIKGDTHGSVQALSDALEELGTDEVAVEVIHRGVGAVNESDVLLASTSDATILGFHVRPDTKARDVAEEEGIEIRTYSVIYEAVQDVRLALEGMLEPEEREVVVGTAEIRQLFKVPKVGTVAGCYVESGEIQRNLPVRVLRDHVEVYQGEIGSLKRFQDDVREVREGFECGISIEGFNDVKVGDLIECFRVDEVARSLESPTS